MIAPTTESFRRLFHMIGTIVIVNNHIRCFYIEILWLSGVYTVQEAPPNHDIINLVMVSELHLGCAMSIFWMLCVFQVYSPAQDRCSKQILVAGHACYILIVL